jgi:hypothetical protein
MGSCKVDAIPATKQASSLSEIAARNRKTNASKGPDA